MLRIVILAIALIAGGGAAWLAYSLLASDVAPTVAEAPEAIPTKAVLVASTAIGRGEKLGPANLTWQTWPEPALGEGMIFREEQPDAIETYTGWASRNALLPGEPIRAGRLAEGNGGLMSLMLTPGMRAVAVRVSAESGAGGFILPNDRVDLIHTVMRDADGDGAAEPVSTTLLRNVRVLAVDQMAEETEAGVAKVAETATLELTPEQVEVMTEAQNSGRIAIALRSVADYDEAEVGEVARATPRLPEEAREQTGMARTAEQEDNGPELSPHPAEPPPSMARRMPVTVRIIGSGEVETVTIDRDAE